MRDICLKPTDDCLLEYPGEGQKVLIIEGGDVLSDESPVEFIKFFFS